MIDDCTPGTLKPEAIAAIEVLRRARGRTLTVRTMIRRLLPDYARRVGGYVVVHLMRDMANLGLVRWVGNDSYRLLVEGPTRKDH